MRELLKSLYKTLLVPNKTYKTEAQRRGAALISYIPASLYENEKDLLKHQNRGEAKVMTQSFLDSGFDFDVVFSEKSSCCQQG